MTWTVWLSTYVAGRQKEYLEEFAPGSTSLEEMSYEEGNKLMTEVFPGLKVYELNDLVDNHRVQTDTIINLRDLTRPQGLALVAKIKAKRDAEEV